MSGFTTGGGQYGPGGFGQPSGYGAPASGLPDTAGLVNTVQPTTPTAPATTPNNDPFANFDPNMIFNNPISQGQLAQQGDWLKFMTGNYYPWQEQMGAGQLTGMYNGQPTLPALLQQANIALANNQSDNNTALAFAQLTGQYGGAPTLQAQQLMNYYQNLNNAQGLQGNVDLNQLLLAQGNQGLTARGQNLGYAQTLAGLLGQGVQANAAYNQDLSNLGAAGFGAQSNYANTLAGLASNVGNQDVQMAGIQAQLAQSPLVAWYTARGMAPPQSAVMSAQAPNLSQELGTLSQYGMSSPNMNQMLGSLQGAGMGPQNLYALEGAVPGIGQYTPTQLQWNWNPQGPMWQFSTEGPSQAPLNSTPGFGGNIGTNGGGGGPVGGNAGGMGTEVAPGTGVMTNPGYWAGFGSGGSTNNLSGNNVIGFNGLTPWQAAPGGNSGLAWPQMYSAIQGQNNPGTIAGMLQHWGLNPVVSQEVANQYASNPGMGQAGFRNVIEQAMQGYNLGPGQYTTAPRSGAYGAASYGGY